MHSTPWLKVGVDIIIYSYEYGVILFVSSMFASYPDAPSTEAPTTHPTITVTVAVSGDGTPTAGQSYTLTCSVSGASVTTYQWRKDGSVLQGETTEMLSFSPLRLSDAGQYTCEVTVNSMTLTDDVDISIPSESFD